MNSISSGRDGADLSNWRATPHSRWAFRNPAAILPTAPIASAEDGLPLPQGEAGLADFQLDVGGVGLDWAGFMAATAGDALVVLHHGRIVHEAYANGNGPHAPHILMSASKSVVGLLAGILSDAGELDMEAPVAAYVPEVEAGPFAGAALRYLADMRTGVVLDAAEQARYAAAAGWDPPATGESASDLHTWFASLRAPHGPHGGPFSYVSANTDLLGWAMERATGRRFAELLSDRLWKRLAADDALITTDGKGAARCTGGLCVTARDFARIGQLMVEGGRRAGVQVVPSAWLDDLATGGDPQAWSAGEWGGAFTFAGARMSYRSGWYVVHDEPTTLFAMGIHGQNLFVDRANRIVLAKMSSQDAPIDYRAVPLTHMAFNAVRRMLLE